MSQPTRYGLPPVRGPLARTSFTAPPQSDRVTIIPKLPLVPASALLGAALAADESPRSVVWVHFPQTDSDIDEGVAAAAIAATLASAGSQPLAELTVPLLLVVELDERVSPDTDAFLLSLLAGAPLLSLAAICSGRRLFETLGRSEHGAIVTPPSAMVSNAEQVAAQCATFGLVLSEAQAAELARGPLSIPDLLPSVLASMSADALEAPHDAVLDLIEEAEQLLAMRLRGMPDPELLAAAALALPAQLDAAALSVVDPTTGGTLQLERATQAGIVHRDTQDHKRRYRFDPILKGLVSAELRRRDLELAQRAHAALARHYRRAGAALPAIEHYIAAGDWAGAVAVIDETLFRLITEDAQRLREIIVALPRQIREENPRLALVLELAWQPGDERAQGQFTATRRAAGAVAALPDVMSPWDRVHLHLVRTLVLRTKGDHAAALAAADALDELLEADDVATGSLATLAQANYQSGMTRLLALDLVGARESFGRSLSLVEEVDGYGDPAARATEAIALVRVLEGEAEQASTLLTYVDGGTLGVAGLVAHALVAIARLDPRDARHWLARLTSTQHDNEFWPFAVHASNRYGLYWGDPVETDANLDRSWADHGDQIVDGSTAQLLLTSDAADLALMLGQLSRARTALEQRPERNTWIAVSRARLALLSGNPKHALLYILEAQGRGRTERYGQLDLAVLRAAAEFALDREEDATASLLRALNQAANSGAIVPFHLLPNETLGDLAELHPDAKRFFADHELTGTTYLAPYQKVAGTLSERELVVLRALDPGATVEQVAKKLFVASNTVKAQLRSIYRKLNVSTRTEAMLVAAELGLLDQDSRSA